MITRTDKPSWRSLAFLVFYVMFVGGIAAFFSVRPASADVSYVNIQPAPPFSPSPAATMQGLSNPWPNGETHLQAIFHDSYGNETDITTTATWNSSNPFVGTVDANGVFYPLSEGVTAITASWQGTFNLPFTITTISPPNASTLAEPHEPLESPDVILVEDATNDNDIQRGVENIIWMVYRTGLLTGDLWTIKLKSHFHEALANSGGVELPPNVPAMIVYPGLFYESDTGQLIHVYDGRYHVVLDTPTSIDMRIQNVTSTSDGGFTISAEFALHELLHGLVEEFDIDAGNADDEEDTITSVGDIVTRTVGIYNRPDLFDSHANQIQQAYSHVNTRPGGQEILNHLGITDIDGDGIPNVIDSDMDGDGVLNGSDNCPQTYNPNQQDSDGDGRGDACDAPPPGHPVYGGSCQSNATPNHPQQVASCRWLRQSVD